MLSLRWALLSAGVFFSAAYAPHLAHSTDDAFITYRCAWNLVAGHGLVFNPGEDHLATTAPGFALLLATLAFPFGPEAIPLIGGIVSLASLAACSWLLATRFTPAGWPVLPGLLVLLGGSRWLVEILGHETLLQAFLLIAGIAALSRNRQVRAGILFALATFVRPDAGAFAAAAGVHHWISSRRFPLALGLAYAPTTAALAGLVLAFAGEIVPASMAVKQAEATVPALSLGRTYVSSLAGWFARDYGIGTFALLGSALVACGLVRRLPRATSRLLVVAATALLFYPLVGVTFAPWYFVFPLVGLSFFASLPLAHAVAERRAVPAIAFGCLLVLALSSSVPWMIDNGAFPPDPRMRPNRRVAEWIRANSRPDDALAAVEVGFLAYYSRRPVLDLVGLGSPGALEALVTGRIADYFFEHEPTFLVRHPVFDYIQGPILDDPRFAERYRLEREFAEEPDAPVIGVFRRVDA